MSVSFRGLKQFGEVKEDLVSLVILDSLVLGEWPGEEFRLFCLIYHCWSLESSFD